jgi:hypothetical protein
MEGKGLGLIRVTISEFAKRNWKKYCDGMWPFARQRLGKHGLKAGIIAEAEVILLGNC